MATLDGQFVFGAAVRIAHTPHPNSHQIVSFPGLNGQASSYMGSRGRLFVVDGCFFGDTAYDCIQAEYVMRTFADGQGHELVDTFDRAWAPVIFRGDIQTEGGPKPGSVGGYGYAWVWKYRLVLEGLS